MELMTPKSIGLILRSIQTNYKFVSAHMLLVELVTNRQQPMKWPDRCVCRSNKAVRR
jgi:hypothetical protein